MPYYRHMDAFDHHIASFHEFVERAASKWRRHVPMIETHLGDTLPGEFTHNDFMYGISDAVCFSLPSSYYDYHYHYHYYFTALLLTVGLVVPVTMDCFIDGFLIGVSCALSPSAGIILGAANCLEMSFLGMAYAARLTKCTGSSVLARYSAMLLPPLLMWLSAGLGAFLAVKSTAVPAVYVAFVAFGVVALLALACGELLIEAREAQGENERWWIQVIPFVGVYIVLMMSSALDHRR